MHAHSGCLAFVALQLLNAVVILDAIGPRSTPSFLAFNQRVPVTMSALILSILLTIAGLGLFIFTWGLHPFAWEPTLHPLLGWILCGLGVLIPGISFWWLVIEEEEWEVWASRLLLDC